MTKETDLTKRQPYQTTAPVHMSLVELYEKQDQALLMPRDVAMKFLNVLPPDGWVKVHPFTKHKYLPIDKVEFLLRVIFREFKITVMDYKMILNAVTVHVRVEYKDLTSGDWRHHDGVGAWELQTQSKTGALKLDMSNINNGAVQMALPIAKTQALKDATDHLGTVFGSNLNRKDTLADFVAEAEPVETARLKRLIEAAESVEELEMLRPHLNDATYELFETKLNSFMK